MGNTHSNYSQEECLYMNIISISKKLEEKLKSEIKSMKKRGESKENSYDHTFKILVFGDSSKTSVIQRYLTGLFKFVQYAERWIYKWII